MSIETSVTTYHQLSFSKPYYSLTHIIIILTGGRNY